MGSKIARKLLNETPPEIRAKVRQDANRRIILMEVWQKWCELDYANFDAWLHKSMNFNCENACDWPNCTLPKCITNEETHPRRQA